MNTSNRQSVRILLVVVLTFTILLPVWGQAGAAPQQQRNSDRIIYLPIVNGQPDHGPVMLGTYPTGWLALQTTFDNEIRPFDQWAGKRLSLIGTFVDIVTPNYENYVTEQLTRTWNNGYTPFVNIMTAGSAYQVANGSLDNYLRQWAEAFKNYASQGQRVAYIAPLPEMNGDWVSYGLNPSNYKGAFLHIQTIFSQVGVPSSSVQWVFAPNGWTDSRDPQIPEYYPGNSHVDVIAFSAYNFGYCPTNRYKSWPSPQDVYGKYLPLMRTIAPGKPIFIAQTGVTDYGPNSGTQDKNNWLESAYNYLAYEPNVEAIIYLNMQKDCRYTIFSRTPSITFNGYRSGIQNPAFEYISPAQLRESLLSSGN
jgi:hypothetical protein